MPSHKSGQKISKARFMVVMSDWETGSVHTEAYPDSKRPSTLPPIEIKEVKDEKNKISTTFALINLFKGMVGPGCFALPLSFKQAGLWAGFALVFLLGIVSSICMVKLVRCSQYLCKRNKKSALDYGQMAEEAFRSSFAPFQRVPLAGKILVNGCLIALQLGICSVFYIFVVEHAQEVVDHIWPHNTISKNLYFLFALPCFLLLCTVRTIRVISWICLFGNILMATSLTIILQELVRGEHYSVNALPAITDANGVSLAAGSILYALEGQAVVLPLENKMQEPKAMKGPTGVLVTGVNLVSLIYAGCGFYGYLTYGNDVQASVTLNLTNSPLDFSVKCMLLTVVFSGFLIQQFPLVEMIWPPVKDWLNEKKVSRPRRILFEYLFRYSIVFIALGLSFAIPNLDDIIPLVGVTAGMMLALVLPACLETICFLPVWLKEWPKLSTKLDTSCQGNPVLRARVLTMYMVVFSRWRIALQLASNGFFAALGIFFIVTGLIANIKQLINGHSETS